MGLLETLYKGILNQEEPQGILNQPQPTGILGALYANPSLQRQFAKQREFMTPPTSVTDPRWLEHAERQKQADHFLMAADLLGAAAPFAKPGLMAALRAAGPATESYMARTGLLQPITAYHGSPHLFDKFDMSKVGTGEGAQAYGHGLYFAENPAVAKGYQRGLSQTELYVGGQKWTPQTPVEKEALNYLQNANDMGSANPFAHAKQTFRQVERPAAGSAKAREFDEVIERLQGSKPDFAKGSLYKVDLPDEAIGKMLDWDKPLSQQPESVKAVLGQLKKASGKSDRFFEPFAGREMNGMQLYRALQRELGDEGASKVMREAGVTGIKYLDQGSRAGGSGTNNFVVFDDSLPRILGRE